MSCPYIPTSSDTKLKPFYFPWPNLGIKLSRQWDNLRSNTNKEAPLIRAAYVDPQPASANADGENDLSGWAIGERDFRNKFRIFYDKGADRFSIQYNAGTEDVECWNDYLSIRQVDGRVTIHGYGGLDTTAGGFYTPFARNLAVSATFTPPSTEWVWNHNLNAKPILWNTFNLEDKSLVPQSVDVSNPNTAYFYFVQPYAGRAIAAAEQVRGDGICVTDGRNEYSGITSLNFSNADFYLSHGGSCQDNSVVVNLQPLAGSSGVTAHSALTGLGSPADDHPQYSLVTGTRAFTGTIGGITPVAASDLATKGYVDGAAAAMPGFYGIFIKESRAGATTYKNDTLIFDSEAFYLNPTSVGKPMVSLRGIAGSGSGVTAHSALTGLGSPADDHPQYSLVTGARAFTGTVGGITPVVAADLATKGYVDTNIGPGFYGIYVQESDGNPPTFRNDTLIFDSQYFYLRGNRVHKPLISLRPIVSGSTALAQDFGIKPEWIFNHNLNTANLIWAVYDNRQIAIIPEKVDTSDPNTTYFYFIPAIAGRAVLLGGLNTAGQVGSQTGITSVTDGTSTYNNQVKLNFSNRDFYLSAGGTTGSSVVNLTSRYIDNLQGFIETASVMNLNIDPWAPYDYRVNFAKVDCRAGSCTGGFYLLRAKDRASTTVWKGHSTSVRVAGLDPLSISTTPLTVTPSSNLDVKTGDCLIFSISVNTAAKWVRVTVQAERL